MSHPFNFFSNEYGSFSNNSPSTAGTDIEGNSSINQYILHEVIGEGSYGKVRMAFNQDTQTEIAIKIINKDDLKRKRQLIRDEKGRTKFKTAFDDLQKELSIMKQLDHPNIVKLYEIIENCDSSFVYIAMEHLKSGQILEWDDTNKQFYSTTFPGYIPENMLRDIFSGIISGLEYLHQHGIIHRDIKPQNILQDQYGTPKIVDFGSAIQLADSSRDILTTSEGSHAFMAPETNVENLSNKGYSGKAADIWAMGVTFFALTFNQLPFYNDDILELFKEVESKPLEFPQCRYVSFELRNMLEGLLEKDPKKRTKLEQLKEHSWFSQNKSSYLVGDLSNKQGFLHPKDRIKKSNTLEEKSFNWGNICNEDVKQLRRAKTSQFDKWGKPQKKVHRSSQ